MRSEIFYVLLNNENYEFLDENGELTTNILVAERFDLEKLAFQEIEVLDEPEEYDVVRVNLSYELEKCR
jgi:hypothetical protein